MEAQKGWLILTICSSPILSAFASVQAPFTSAPGASA
ncbi:hypothetical protein NB694_002527 [Pantoea ananatis]|nr:hypothetical protein [Pantoea ananatis]